MESLAWQICPRSSSHEKFQEIDAHLKSERQELSRALEESKSQLKRSNRKLADLQKEIATLKLAGSATRDEHSEKVDAAKELTTRITELTRRIPPLRNRQLALQEFGGLSGSMINGINESFQLRLPMVVSGGQAMVNRWFLLTVLHTAHVFAGLVAIVFALYKSRLEMIENVALYWHFVVFLWILLFLLLYLF